MRGGGGCPCHSSKGPDMPRARGGTLASYDVQSNRTQARPGSFYGSLVGLITPQGLGQSMTLYTYKVYDSFVTLQGGSVDKEAPSQKRRLFLLKFQ